jgi:ketosteroid isomerase-like protein
MSTPADVVRRCYDAWNSGDLDALEQLLAPGIEIDATDRVMNPERYSGREGFRRMVAELYDIWDSWHVKGRDFTVQDDRVFVTHEVHARGKGSGVELVRDYWSVWTVRGGEVVKLSLHVDRDRALAAAGLTSGSKGTSRSSGSRPTGP